MEAAARDDQAEPDAGRSSRWSPGWSWNPAALSRSGRALPWLPIAPALVWLIALLANLKSEVDAFYMSSDSVAGEVIAALMPQRPPGSTVLLGNIPYYCEIWFNELTQGLPDHRQLQEIMPWALTLAGIGLLTWATVRVADRWAGMIVAVVCACGSPNLLGEQFGWSVHSQAFTTVCVGGAAVVPLTLSAAAGREHRSRWLACLAGCAVVLGLGVADDELALIGGLIPLVLTALVVGWRLPAARRWRLAADTAAVSIGAAVIAAVATSVAHAQHLQPTAFPITFSPLNTLWNHVGDLVGSLALLGSGNFGGSAISLTSGLALLAAIAVALGWVAAFGVLRDHARQTLRDGAGPETAADRTAGAPGSPDPTTLARTGLLTFWLISGLLIGLAFVCTSVPIGISTARYVVTAYYGLAVVLAIAATQRPRRWPRLLLGLGVTIVVTGAALGQVQRQAQSAVLNLPDPRLAGEVLTYVRAHGLTKGYAGYWDAYPLTWETQEGMQVYPVTPCGPTLCPMPEQHIPSWFTPSPGAHSFLVVDSEQAAANNGLSGPSPSFGKPSEIAVFGDLTVYGYTHDIAAQFGP